jgi:septum formation protein
VHLVLASASPARLGVLRAAGTDPLVRVSGIDEDALLTELAGATPAETVTALALAKARAVASAVAQEVPDAVVVGCDSMLELDGELVGKPGTVDVARGRWDRMAGQRGELVTGHAVVRLVEGAATAEIAGHAATAVSFATPSTAELEAYLGSGEPLAVAGAFTLDGLGGWFVEEIQGDPHNVVGVCLPAVRRMLLDLGLTLRDIGFGTSTSAAGRSAASRPRRQRS